MHFPGLTEKLLKIPVGFVMSGGSSSSESLSPELVTGVICFDVCGVVYVLSAAAVSTWLGAPSPSTESGSSFEIDSIS